MSMLAVDAVKQLLSLVGEDPEREGLKETPSRVVKSLMEQTSGYEANVAEIFKTFADGAQNYDAMVLQGNINFVSLCEHHMLPFFGVVHIGYLPNDRIVGLSKLSRVTEVFAKRLQVQERMTRQIAEAIQENLNPVGVGVVVRARHLCMEARGVKKHGSVTVTSALLGGFRHNQMLKSEFLQFVAHLDSGPISL